MSNWHETLQTFVVWNFFGVIILLTLAEWIFPRKAGSSQGLVRLTSNVAIGFVNTYVLHAAIPVAAVGWAMLVESRGWGALNVLHVSIWFAVPISVLAIDLAHYLRHLWLHRNAWLWRIHITHHSDLDYDFTTGLRFHPLDALFSLLAGMGVVALLGAPVLAVILAELLATTNVLIEHSNVRLPQRLDRVLRRLVVTPDMHRVHHSRAEGDTNHNLATVFSFWDRLFGTYREYPASATADLVIGLPEFDDRKHLRLDWMLAQPFLRAHEPAHESLTGASTEGGRPHTGLHLLR
jgi:sterol desaturase/sphingolipid hydroxylase (fatty acid hydroxylase superfamily)